MKCVCKCICSVLLNNSADITHRHVLFVFLFREGRGAEADPNIKYELIPHRRNVQSLLFGLLCRRHPTFPTVCRFVLKVQTVFIAHYSCSLRAELNLYFVSRTESCSRLMHAGSLLHKQLQKVKTSCWED